MSWMDRQNARERRKTNSCSSLSATCAHTCPLSEIFLVQKNSICPSSNRDKNGEPTIVVSMLEENLNHDGIVSRSSHRCCFFSVKVDVVGSENDSRASMTLLDERSFSSPIFITCRADMTDRCVLCFFFFRFLSWTRRQNSTGHYFCDGWNLSTSPVFTVTNNRLLHSGMSRKSPCRCERSQTCHLFIFDFVNITWR